MIVHRVEVGKIVNRDLREWRQDVLSKLREGMRAISLYGKRQGDDVTLTAILLDPTGLVHVLRTTATVQLGYHEMTTSWPALHCFERELSEQTGVRVAGHPWLKPIRFEGRDKAALDQYPFYKVEGKEIHEVAVGPIHAGVIEPGSFRFMCHGEQVYHLEIQLGYQHRGVERRLLEGDPRQLTPLVETIAGDTSVAHAWAYCAAIESLTALVVPIEIEVARAVALELERVAMHLGGLAGLAADVGFLQGASSYGRLRTTAINTTMRLCGSRFGRGALRPGGIRMKMDSKVIDGVRTNIDLLKNDLQIINERFLSSATVQHRLRGVGIMTEPQAKELGIVGHAARASGVPIDLRDEPSQGAYKILPLPMQTEVSGDCLSRAALRILEMEASLCWLSTILSLYPDWPRSQNAVGPLAPSELVVSLVEGWRGEVVHCIETNESGRLGHYKVQDPSFRNWMGLAVAVRGNEISDFPICNKSFDLSYCGNDL